MKIENVKAKAAKIEPKDSKDNDKNQKHSNTGDEKRIKKKT